MKRVGDCEFVVAAIEVSSVHHVYGKHLKRDDCSEGGVMKMLEEATTAVKWLALLWLALYGSRSILMSERRLVLLEL